MKLKKLTIALLAAAVTVASLPAVTAEEYLAVSDVTRAPATVSGVNGAEESPAEDFEYEINEDGESVTITGYSGDGGDVVIPSEIEGKRVTEIGVSAFQWCTSLISVIIPDSVTSIGNDAFYGCTSLTIVTMPDSVTSIGYYAFKWCISLASVTIPDSVTSIGSFAFEDCTSLTSVIIPDSVTSIGGFAFNGCTSLASVTISDSVTSIGDFAFRSCTSLTSMTIPDSVTKIGDSAFIGCYSLTAINVDEKNENYSSQDGVLFNKDKSELIQYPAGKEDKSCIIPDSVTSIVDYAFYGCTSLTSVIIPESVTGIGVSAFDACTSLTIYGYENSYAQDYSKEYQIPFKIIGKEAAIDGENNIIIENSNLTGKTLEAEKSADSNEEKIIYNITLKNENGEEVQPEGEVTVKIPLPEGWKQAEVSRRESDGSLTDMKAVCEKGYAVFVTDHFSEYVLAKKPDVQRGEINGDGKLSAVDAKWVLQAVSGSRKLTPEQQAAADVNGDGKINAVDAKWILQAVSGSRVLD